MSSLPQYYVAIYWIIGIVGFQWTANQAIKILEQTVIAFLHLVLIHLVSVHSSHKNYSFLSLFIVFSCEVVDARGSSRNSIYLYLILIQWTRIKDAQWVEWSEVKVSTKIKGIKWGKVRQEGVLKGLWFFSNDFCIIFTYSIAYLGFIIRKMICTNNT